MPVVVNDRGSNLYRVVFFSRHPFPNKIWTSVAQNLHEIVRVLSDSAVGRIYSCPKNRRPVFDSDKITGHPSAVF
jgi:hypothetical protein